jgi:hypothetical protein
LALLPARNQFVKDRRLNEFSETNKPSNRTLSASL